MTSRSTAPSAAAALALAATGLVAFASPATAVPIPGSFTTVTPVRIQAATSVASHHTLTVDPDVPSAAAAVVMSVTAAGSTAKGAIKAFRSDTSPGEAINLSFATGQTVTNQVTVRVGSDGKVRLYNTSAGSVTLKADLIGWYAGGSVTDPGMFTASDAVRVLNTRPTGKVAGGTTKSFLVGSAAAGDTAALNLTAESPEAGGSLTAFPARTQPGNRPNLKYKVGQTTVNAANVPTGSNGKVSLRPSAGPVNLLADAAGWFKQSAAPGTLGTGGYTPLTPTRILSTKTGLGAPLAKVPAKGTVTVTVAGAGGVPAALADAAVLNVTAMAGSAGGYLTAFAAGSTRPTVTQASFAAGQTVSTLVTSRLSADGKVTFYNNSSQPVDLTADVVGWYRNSQSTGVPAGVLNLAKWRETVPVDSSGGTTGTAKNIDQPTLATYELSPSFENVNDSDPNAGVRFRADTSGATTSGSNFPRSELREMADSSGTVAAWSNTGSATHTMTVVQAITHLPDRTNGRNPVVVDQIHNGDRDIIVLRAERVPATGKIQVFAKADNDTSTTSDDTNVVVDADYVLGTKFKVQFQATNSGIMITYWKSPTDSTPTKTVTRDEAGTTWFFKTGCYTQASSKVLDDSDTSNDGQYGTGYGEVIIYGATVEHR